MKYIVQYISMFLQYCSWKLSVLVGYVWSIYFIGFIWTRLHFQNINALLAIDKKNLLPVFSHNQLSLPYKVPCKTNVDKVKALDFDICPGKHSMLKAVQTAPFWNVKIYVIFQLL